MLFSGLSLRHLPERLFQLLQILPVPCPVLLPERLPRLAQLLQRPGAQLLGLTMTAVEPFSVIRMLGSVPENSRWIAASSVSSMTTSFP